MLVGYAVLRGPVPRRQHAERPDARGAGLDVLAHEGAAKEPAAALDQHAGRAAPARLRPAPGLLRRCDAVHAGFICVKRAEGSAASCKQDADEKQFILKN